MRTTSRATLFLFFVAVLLLAGAAALRGQSALDGFDPGANSTIYALAVQVDGKILVGGNFTMLGGGGTGTTTRNFLGRLNPDGTLDTSFNPGANSTVYALAVQADGKILIGGFFTGLGGGTGTTARNRIGRLNADGSLDTSFNPGANDFIIALAVQGDGKILVGGNFTGLGGGTGTTARNNIGRLNADGTVDGGFNPGANGPPSALAVQADGKIVVGGGFTTLGGGGTGTVTRNYIGRLNLDGTIDASFDPGANNGLYAVALQADGKIVVSGAFTTLGGGGTGTSTRNYIGRLNANGSLDVSFTSAADSFVYALVVQANGKIVVGGSFSVLGSGSGGNPRSCIGRFNPDGTIDVSFDPGASSAPFALALQPDGKILAGGNFTTLGGGGTGTATRNRIGRLNPDGTLDTIFDPGVDGSINAIAVQADGQILVGGFFSHLGGGGTGTTLRYFIGRLQPDGMLDTSFNPGANGGVFALAVQPNGKILVGGFFTMIGGGGQGNTPRNNFARLNSDGTVDTSFDPSPNSLVNVLAVQADGKILAAGSFTIIGGAVREHLARLNPDGTADVTVNPRADQNIYTLAVQGDGKILVGGQFNTLAGTSDVHMPRSRIGRFNANTTLDASFDPGANNWVNALALQTDGGILVGGDFTALGGGGAGVTTRNYIARLNPDGTVDPGFDPGANGRLRTFAVQTDGRILVGGDFTTLGGGGTGTTTRNRIARLDPNGTLDPSFDPGANNIVWALAVEANGKILAGGDFTTLGGGATTTRNHLGRLTNTDAALQALTVVTNGTTINWLRSGASPEVARASFELSTGGINYTALGNPARINGGWQLTGQTLPTQQNIFIRARGFYATGHQDGSGSIVEMVRNAFISSPPTPTQIVSQKTHGAGNFGINLPLTGSPGIECRSGGASNDYQLVFVFPSSVTFNSASVTAGAGSVSGTSGNATTTVTVNLTGVTNVQRITVTLFGVNNGTSTGDVGVQMGMLIGDANSNGAVNSADVAQTKSRIGQTVDATNFRSDVNANGSINASDTAIIKAKTGTALP